MIGLSDGGPARRGSVAHSNRGGKPVKKGAFWHSGASVLQVNHRFRLVPRTPPRYGPRRMDAARTTAAEGSAPAAARGWWWAAWGGLLAWQLWLALGLFGPAPLTGLTDDRPVISGAHPQHLYIG